jgi:hypothetical protein
MREHRKTSRPETHSGRSGSDHRRAARAHDREAFEAQDRQLDRLLDAVDSDDEEPLPEPGDFWLELDDED